MKKLLLIVTALGAVSALFAQMPSASESGRPLSQRQQARADERAERQKRFDMRLDSLMSSAEFQFLPISMEQIPDGSLQMINNFYYYVGVFKIQQLQVHLPVMAGRVIDYPVIANFDTDQIFNLQTSRTKYGWETSLSAKDADGNVYTFNFNVYSATGEAILNLLTKQYSIKYIGSIVPNDVLAGVP